MHPKTQQLIEIEGYETAEDCIADFIGDSLCPAICTNKDCDYAVQGTALNVKHKPSDQ